MHRTRIPVRFACFAGWRDRYGAVFRVLLGRMFVRRSGVARCAMLRGKWMSRLWQRIRAQISWLFRIPSFEGCGICWVLF